MAAREMTNSFCLKKKHYIKKCFFAVFFFFFFFFVFFFFFFHSSRLRVNKLHAMPKGTDPTYFLDKHIPDEKVF